jgi:glycosyl transferase, family 25
MINFYLINLDRSPDRLAWISQRLTELNIQMQRISAVDGKKLSPAELARWNRAWEKTFGMVPNELACFLSHRVIWQKMVESNEACAFIAEDDIHISDDLPRFLADSNWMPPDADLVKAETVKQRVWLSHSAATDYYDHQLWQLRSFHGGSAGYFIRQQGAVKLLELTDNYCMSPDQVLFNPKYKPARNLISYQIVPALVAQDWVVESAVQQPKIESLILNERNALHGKTRIRNQSLSGLIWYKVSNPLRKAGKRGLETTANLLGTHRVTKIAFESQCRSAAA